MSNKSDDKLISELFVEYRQMMFKMAMGILNNESDAEDAVQDSFLWIINNFDKISQIPCHERGNYFASIIEHRSIDICRKKTNHPTEDFDEQLDLKANERVEETVLSNAAVDEIKSAMNELSSKDYEMLYLYLFKQMSPKEIGEAMGIPENNIRTYIKRARKRFIKILHKRGIDHDG